MYLCRYNFIKCKKPDLYWYFLLGLALIIIAAIFVTVYLLMHQGAENFRFVRIRAWLHPEEYAADEGLQAMQARYAIGAGGIAEAVSKMAFGNRMV